MGRIYSEHRLGKALYLIGQRVHDQVFEQPYQPLTILVQTPGMKLVTWTLSQAVHRPPSPTRGRMVRRN